MDAQWRCAGSAAATRRECGDAQVRDDSSSASRRARQNDATAQPCPARPSRACLASRTNRVPVVTRIGGRGDGAAVDDGPGCRRRADAAALSSRGRDLGGRGPKRRVLRQADGGRAQTSPSWLADTLLSQDRAAPIRFAVPRGMQRGGRKRAVLEPDEYPASRTSVDTGHDPHLRHAGTAARPPAAAPAGPGPPMAPPIRVPETHGGGRPGSGIMVSEGLPPLTPLTAGSGGQPATPGRERRSTAYPGYWRERI